MPLGGRQGSSLPPPPPSIGCSPPPPAGPALTCRIPSTPRVSSPRPREWRVLSAPCATMSVGNDGRPSAPTSGPCQRPPLPRPAPFLDDAAVVAVVIRRRRVVPPPLPFQLASRCVRRTSVVAFFSAPVVVRGPVVAVAAPVLLGVAAVGARESPVPTPRGQGWSRHPTAKPVDTAAPVLLLLPSSRWMASANSTARSSAGRHRRRRLRRRRRRVLPRLPLTAIVTRL